MAKFYETLSPAHLEFIAGQKIYFVASAPHTGRVNLSPKGMDTFRVLSNTRVGYLDSTGSGNETAAHLRENGRMTIMMCSFTTAPLIFRIYGRGRAVHPGSADWNELRPRFGPPLPGERETLINYAVKKGADGMAAYRAEKNQHSIDGLPTSLLERTP